MKILLTATESVTEDGETDIHLFGRTDDGDRVHRVVSGFEPYFYAPTPGVKGRETDLLGQSGITRLEGPSEHPYSPLTESSVGLTRVVVETPSDVRDARELFDRTWAADVPFTNRFRIDKELYDWVSVPDEKRACEPADVQPVDGPDGPDPDPRIVTVDIEVDDRGAFPEPEVAPNRVTCIVAHDSYTDETVAFFDMDDRPVDDVFPDGKPANVDELRFEPNERRMLIRFFSFIADRDPDVLTGWNFENFDAPYLVSRGERVGASPSRLSPLDRAYISVRGEATIWGRTCYDLLQAYKDSQFSELRKYSLDYVAEQELGESKLDFEGSYWDLYQDDPEKFVRYCARDVALTVGINETAGTLAFKDSLRKQVGVDFEGTRNNYQFIEMMVRRRLHDREQVGPTKDASDAESYPGGQVFDAYNGVAQNVVGIDVESLYPWTMFMLNASPETKLSDKGAAEVWFDNFDPIIEAPNGVYFEPPSDGNRGLFASLVKDALDLKEGYRDKKHAAPAGSDEEARYETRYSVAKTITNSIYGVVGWEQFFLYDKDVAEAVTLMGQAVIKRTAAFSSEQDDIEVIYGDTDSNYISFPDSYDQKGCIEAAEQLCATLEDEVYPELAEEHGIPAERCEWRIDPEMFTPRFFMWGRKKYYSYRPTWKEGMDPGETLAEPPTIIKGSSSKRSDRASLTQSCETAVIEAILDGDEERVVQIVHDHAQRVTSDDPDWKAIGIPGGIQKELDEYPENYAHAKAARNSNAILGTEFKKGSKPKRVVIDERYFEAVEGPVSWLAFDSPEQLADKDIQPNTSEMLDKLVRSPLGPIVEAVGYDIGSAIRGESVVERKLSSYF